MEIATREVHAVLSYVSAMERQGQAATVAQVEAFASGERRTFATGGFLTTAIPSYGRALEQLAGKVSVESFTDWMERLDWVSVGRNVALTSLGRAVLRELDQREVSADSA
ncbi:MAG: hypothetical protein WEE66_13530 [Actinomycetota bacterium]